MKNQIRKMGRILRAVMPVTFGLLALSASSFAAGVGLIDTSSFGAMAGTIVSLVQLIAAAGVVICLCLAVFKFVARDVTHGFAYTLGVIVGALVVGYAPAWTAGMTGITVPGILQIKMSGYGELLPVNDALNRSKHFLGMDYRLLFAAIAVSSLIFLMRQHVLAAASFVALVIAAKIITAKDIKLPQLWCLSVLQGAHYDPGV